MWINVKKAQLERFASWLNVYGGKPEDLELVKEIHEVIERYESPVREVFIEKAREEYATDEVEIDDMDVAIAPSDDGCWVMGWLYVSNGDVDACEECGAIPGTPEYGTVGDGYDGLCPSCADKAENDE